MVSGANYRYTRAPLSTLSAATCDINPSIVKTVVTPSVVAMSRSSIVGAWGAIKTVTA
jgi:hypothetical protein